MRHIQSPLSAALALCAVIVTLWSVYPSSARAQAGHIQGAVRVDAHLGIGWEGSVGPGLRLDIPLSRDGLIPSVNDELALTLGADVLFFAFDRYDRHNPYDHPPRHSYYYDHYRHERGDLTLLFPVALQWNFIVSRQWTLFPELGLAIEHHQEHLHVLPDFGAGARLHFGGGSAALLLRLTFPGAFQIGITW